MVEEKQEGGVFYPPPGKIGLNPFFEGKLRNPMTHSPGDMNYSCATPRLQCKGHNIWLK